MKVGIVFYSRTGNTRQVAKTIEEKIKEKNTEVDLIEIDHIKKPGFFSAGKAAVKQMELPIKNTDFDMGKYNVVIAGSPTWAGNPSPFMKSFLDKAKNIQGKKFAVFSTGMSPLHEREQFKKIMKNYLEKADIKIFDSFLALQFRRGKLVDGVQNIDTFVNQLLKNENE